MLKPIPEAAMPVVEILRRDVKRPTELPARYCIARQGNLRWNIDWTAEENANYCPMGLHPKSTSSAPVAPIQFAGEELYDRNRPYTSGVSEFATWWDNIDPWDAQEAIYLIWPKTIEELALDTVVDEVLEGVAKELGYEAAQYDMFRFRATELELRVKKLEEIVGRLCQCVD